MNRRSLLAFIGLAPIAGVAAALPRPADPVKLAGTGGREVKFTFPPNPEADDYLKQYLHECYGNRRPFIFKDGVLVLENARINDIYR
ncbi:hypothetical protein [Phyllobacterium chamaecytisi]|uniref:hypothetical protein n=1 Tax=Phyllobacterium chamaecytisi TaxID=2876082 RepID=UPI001CC978E8|nr:hypothetical protein [Phyllobacterium sp. KW56]MBZ9600736.1 hypothetical protein [Phyllobacterium sp. KW56]